MAKQKEGKAKKKTCLYRFPIHPLDMAKMSLPSLHPTQRLMRSEMIGMITELSHVCSQQWMDEEMFVDVDAEGNICGMGMFSENPERAVRLGQLTAENWIHMTVPRATSA